MAKQWKINQPAIHIAMAIPRSKAEEAVRQMHLLAAKMKLEVNVMTKQPDANFPEMDYHEFIVHASYLCKNKRQRDRADKALIEFQSVFQSAIFIANNNVNEMKTRREQ